MILDRKNRDEESNFDQEDSQRNYNFLSEPSNTTRIRSPGFYSRTPPLEVPLDLSVRNDGPDEIILQHIPSDEQSSESSQYEHEIYYFSDDEDDSDATTLPWPDSPPNLGFSDESNSSPRQNTTLLSNPFYQEESSSRENQSSSSNDSSNSLAVIVNQEGWNT